MCLLFTFLSVLVLALCVPDSDSLDSPRSSGDAVRVLQLLFEAPGQRGALLGVQQLVLCVARTLACRGGAAQAGAVWSAPTAPVPAMLMALRGRLFAVSGHELVVLSDVDGNHAMYERFKYAVNE